VGTLGRRHDGSDRGGREVSVGVYSFLRFAKIKNKQRGEYKIRHTDDDKTRMD